MPRFKVALAIDTPAFRAEIKARLAELDVELVLDRDPDGGLDQLLELLRSCRPDVLILDARALAGPVKRVMDRLGRLAPPPQVFLVLPSPDPAVMLEALRAGATEVLIPPFGEYLAQSLERVSRARSARSGPEPARSSDLRRFETPPSAGPPDSAMLGGPDNDLDTPAFLRRSGFGGLFGRKRPLLDAPPPEPRPPGPLLGRRKPDAGLDTGALRTRGVLGRPALGVPEKPGVPDSVADRVHFSVTSPGAVRREEPFLVTVWAHLGDQRDAVLRRAREEEGRPGLLVRSKGPLVISRGTVMTVCLSIEGLRIDEPEDTILWEGETGNAVFPVFVPEGAALGPRSGVASIYLEGMRIAQVHFLVVVGDRPEPLAKAGTGTERHKRAFASYATADRDEVLARIQGIKKAMPSLEIFFDVASIQAGEYWQSRLLREIARSDVFYLFWSPNAARSEWVEREWRCALESRGLDFIDPIPLVSPEIAPPPPELAGKQFNDWTLAFMRARR